MFNLSVVKFVLGHVVGQSVSFTAKRVIANNVTPQNTAEVIQAGIGTFALGSMIGYQATKYTEDTIDEAVDLVNQIKAKKAAQETSS